MKLNFVDSMDQVLKIALEREIVALPMPAAPAVEVQTRRRDRSRIRSRAWRALGAADLPGTE